MSLAPDTPIVVFGDDWGRHVSTIQHLFRRIVSRHPVVWVNAIGHRKPRLGRTDVRRAWEKGRAMLSRPAAPEAARADGGPAPAIIQPRVLPWHDRAAIHALNTYSLVRAVRGALRRGGYAAPPVLVTGSPPSVGVVGRLGEIASVYFCMDDFLHLPTVSTDMIAPLEKRLLERVDAVVATARRLTESKLPRSGRAFYLPQGVNYQHFATPRSVPAELASLPRPIVGFAGGLFTRCDLNLLRRVAESVSGGSLVLIGPVEVDTTPLRAPNVHLLGPRTYQSLPAYVQSFDVGLIPYYVNEETVAVDPLKLLEYLAAGIPVVSTPIPEAAKYRGAVAIAEDDERFVAEVLAAVGEPRHEVRRRGQDLARENTWERRADTLLGILGDLVRV